MSWFAWAVVVAVGWSIAGVAVAVIVGRAVAIAEVYSHTVFVPPAPKLVKT